MTFDTILTVKPEHLSRLRPDEAVDVFREMLWAETSRLGIARSLMNVPSAINIADGGVDAEIRGDIAEDSQGLIKQGLTRYQIKTGDFNLGQDRNIKDILYIRDTNELKPRVKSCLDQGGTFVVVLFGWDNPDTSDDQLKQKFLDKLTTIDLSYSNAHVEVWRQNNLCGFIQQFPALALRVIGTQRARFETHQQWSSQDEMRRVFEIGLEHQTVVSNLQEVLREDQLPVHIRILGEAGVGKTRLVLEATRIEDLEALVIYCSASNFRDSDLMAELLRETYTAILVLDECDYDTSATIWNRFRYHSPRIKLVTIYNEYKTASGITYIEMPPLPEEQISNILQAYQVPRTQADGWARECSGSPRVAHVIGWNLVNHPDDLLKPPGTVNIWERYIVGMDTANSIEVAQRRLVLQYLALFKRFGYGQAVSTEAKAIASLIQNADPQISWARFQVIIRNLRERKILQGENTLYISPKMLHVWLWVQWWETFGEHFNLEELQTLPPSLLDWFFPMFEYAKGSTKASRMVQELLGDQGLFR